jgi:uncharacterized protein (UPF0335 family)
MASVNDITELFERYNRIESEIKLLREDKKHLLAEFKDKIDPKAFKAAVQAAKIYSKLSSSEKSEFDTVVEIIEKQFNLEQID